MRAREIRSGKEELMKAQELRGHLVALLIMDETAGGEPDWSVLFGGVQLEEGSDGAVFVGNGQNGPIPLTAEQLGRARPVSKQQRTVLAPAEFFIPMTISPIPEEAKASDYLRTGFKIPK
jgi:hypothetical protein